MNQRSRGPWALLTHSSVYRAFQALVRGSGFRQCWIASHLRPQPGQRILDVGCGPAAILDLLPPMDYVGIDFEPDYIRQATTRFGSRGTFLVKDIRDLDPSTESPFDLVVSLGVLHHLDDTAVTNLLRTAATLLKPGGRFMSLDPARTTPQHPVARLLVSLDRGRHIRHPHHYLSLATPVFGEQNCVADIITDGLKVPYTHCIMTGTKPITE